MNSLAAGAGPAKTKDERWYSDWQDAEHAAHFDGRSSLPSRMLVRNYESFSDVRLLNERLALPDPPTQLLEVGCATGEFYRYLRSKYPRLSYTGVDISRSALDRARQKYPQGRFLASDPDAILRQNLERLRLPACWEIVYSKDVLHHQTDPYGFLTQLLEASSSCLILRTRTRDRGPSVLDAELSCQYHYRGWMPYLVFNLDELVDRIRQRAPEAEILVSQSHQVLGGVENRFLPKECYLPETGTAETAVGVFLQTDRPRQLRVLDRKDGQPRHPIGDRVLLRLRRLFE